MSGKQIKLFLIDGTPGGLTTAEITNWTGHVLSAGRSDLTDLLKRDEASTHGTYLLLGDHEEAVGNTRGYIGEVDIVADRLRYHLRDKDFWDQLVVITSKDANLTKAHVRYLESKLISLASQAAAAHSTTALALLSRRCPRRIVGRGLFRVPTTDRPAGARRQRHSGSAADLPDSRARQGDLITDLSAQPTQARR